MHCWARLRPHAWRWVRGRSGIIEYKRCARCRAMPFWRDWRWRTAGRRARD